MVKQGKKCGYLPNPRNPNSSCPTSPINREWGLDKDKKNFTRQNTGDDVMSCLIAIPIFYQKNVKYTVISFVIIFYFHLGALQLIIHFIFQKNYNLVKFFLI